MKKVVIPILFKAMNHIANDRTIYPEDFGDLLRGVPLPYEFDQTIPIYDLLWH